MKTAQEQKAIEADNKKIEEAVAVSQLMSSSTGKIIKRDLLLMEKKYRFQDIMGIKDEALADQKGIVLGIHEVEAYFKEMDAKSKQPRRDPVTGEVEVMNEKKK
jgi:hypothetical protein